MSRVTVRAAAKINLRLSVGPRRDDGFHPLDTVYQAIGLYDDVSATEADAWTLTLRPHGSIDAGDVPLDERNIALRAAVALARHHGLDAAAALHIDKSIPVAAGLAGGSADAAATLVAVDRLFGLETADEDLLTLAAGLGSDVPFALIGGTAAGGGRGEIVDPLEDRGAWWWVVVQSDEGLSTPAVYAEFDRSAAPSTYGVSEDDRPDLIDALASGDPWVLAERLSNDLTEPALALRPDLRRTFADGREAGALASLLSGSGPTCLFLCEDGAHAQAVRLGLTERGHARVNAAAAPVAGAHVVSY